MRFVNSALDRLNGKRPQIPAIGRLILAVLVSTSLSSGYTVLTHEAIIDSVWDTSVKKLLLKRFPAATPEELEQAHAYAYGGCIIQDMGYYPFSSRFFSDLTHYVRSGDFISALIRESQDLNEYAFALGALEHYAADTEGHRIATNRAVPILYPELRRKFGSSVAYWDNPVAHIRTEFGFDVLQVASGRYATDQYRSFIGFQVSRAVLERAFRDTYGIEMKDVFGNVTLALGSYRHTVSSIIPGMTRVAWSLKKDQLQKEIPGITRKKFLYNLSRSSYEKEWGTEYHKPGFGTRLLTFLFRILPTSGPFRALKIRTPTPEVEKLFMASFNATVDRYRALLANADAGQPELPNENLDVGGPDSAGKYKGTDEAYAKLLGKLADHQYTGMPPELRRNILAYYKDLNPPVSAKSTKKEKAESAKLLDQLDRLKGVPESEP
ncbi:MAG TPA: zinc dependent phospholipase C family protein [Terriglobales bacterium]|nr:zinc dependent phospholipase C family protein [Terriglobales bacterium]